MGPAEFAEALAAVHDAFNEATLAATREKLEAMDQMIADAKEAGLSDAQVGSAVYAERFKGITRLLEAEARLVRKLASERSLMP